MKRDITELLDIVEKLTGLGIEDFLQECLGTEEEQFKAKIENIVKMEEHMNMGQR